NHQWTNCAAFQHHGHLRLRGLHERYLLAIFSKRWRVRRRRWLGNVAQPPERPGALQENKKAPIGGPLPSSMMQFRARNLMRFGSVYAAAIRLCNERNPDLRQHWSIDKHASEHDGADGDHGLDGVHCRGSRL